MRWICVGLFVFGTDWQSQKPMWPQQQGSEGCQSQREKIKRVWMLVRAARCSANSLTLFPGPPELAFCPLSNSEKEKPSPVT